MKRGVSLLAVGLMALGVMACTPGDKPDTAASTSLQGAGGKTAMCKSWCLTPAVRLEVERGRVTGSFWEGRGGGATSTVTGNFTPDGVLQLQFEGADAANLTADIDVGYKDGVIDFVLLADKQCTYTFSLKREAPGSSGDDPAGVPRP